MSNMSYCRFQNTASDLRDCLDHIDDEVSTDEGMARRRMIRTCVEILESLGFTIDSQEAFEDILKSLPVCR